MLVNFYKTTQFNTAEDSCLDTCCCKVKSSHYTPCMHLGGRGGIALKSFGVNTRGGVTGQHHTPAVLCLWEPPQSTRWKISDIINNISNPKLMLKDWAQRGLEIKYKSSLLCTNNWFVISLNPLEVKISHANKNTDILTVFIMNQWW
jgi:hypothetical protein